MPLYTVLAPPQRDGEATPDPVGCVFIKEGFSWPALLVPEVWLLYRRMWLVFFLYVVAAGAVLAIERQTGGPLPGVLLTLAHLLFALEGNGLRRWTLTRRGFRLVGVVEGRRLAEAEIRFFSEWPAATVGGPPKPAPHEPVRPAPVSQSAEDGGVVGLFPAPGGGS